MAFGLISSIPFLGIVRRSMMVLSHRDHVCTSIAIPGAIGRQPWATNYPGVGVLPDRRDYLCGRESGICHLL